MWKFLSSYVFFLVSVEELVILQRMEWEGGEREKI